MYRVYVLKSRKDGSFYIGYTSNLELRLIEHNQGRARFTSKKVPWELVYTEDFTNKCDAIIRERYFKGVKSRRYLEKIVTGA